MDMIKHLNKINTSSKKRYTCSMCDKGTNTINKIGKSGWLCNECLLIAFEEMDANSPLKKPSVKQNKKLLVL